MKSYETLPVDAFVREDETNDHAFYEKSKPIFDHLDSVAQTTVKDIVSQLIVEKKPTILDLMAGWDSHLPKALNTSRTIGLGIDKKELSLNRSLHEFVVHDLNTNPILPFTENTFDIVMCSLSIEYITKPNVFFGEVGRVLKEGGLFLVIFSDRFFPEKVTKIWQESNDKERLQILKSYFAKSTLFNPSKTFISRGKQRDKKDIPAYYFVPSDPVYAIYATKKGNGGTQICRPDLGQDSYPFTEEDIENRKKMIKNTYTCPYCDTKLGKWEVPQTPFTEWPDEYQYICFNDACMYMVRGWGAMMDQGILGSYRLMYSPASDNCHPVPVFNYRILRDGILK